MDIQRVRTALAEAGRTIPGLNCYDWVPDSIETPALFIGEVTVDFDQTFGRGTDELTITCRVLTGRADSRLGQVELAAYLDGSGDRSLKAAFEAARGAPGEAALGGACDDFHVVRVRGYRFYQLGGVDYFGAELTIRVIGDGQ